jgi:hypothetical protein
MLELAYLPPHRSLHLGKVHLCISVDCEHTQVAAVLSSPLEYLRSKHQVCTLRWRLLQGSGRSHSSICSELMLLYDLQCMSTRAHQLPAPAYCHVLQLCYYIATSDW